MNLLAKLISPPPPLPWSFIYIERAILAALLMADCLSKGVCRRPPKKIKEAQLHEASKA